MRSETKEQTVYILSVGKGGSKLKPSSSNPPRSIGGYTINQTGEAQVKFTGRTLAEFADLLSVQLDRPVIDETRLQGRFDITLPVDAHDLEAGADSLQSSLFAAMHSIGLSLEPGKAPLKYLVIDKAQKIPLEN